MCVIDNSSHFFEMCSLRSILTAETLQRSKAGRYWVILGTYRKEVHSCSSLGVIISD